jgi:hypothetical protein
LSAHMCSIPSNEIRGWNRWRENIVPARFAGRVLSPSLFLGFRYKKTSLALQTTLGNDACASRLRHSRRAKHEGYRVSTEEALA